MVRIVIEYDPQTGQVGVNAPQDKILAFGMLELAKQALAAQKPEEKRIVPVGAIPGLRKQ